ncbi:MAG: molybdopterin-dependent oxidoreductase [Deltaproteobacteria bacterium]|nr:molybdopterin-dependent oxidoreductase [Deltaproteobacteria bacterium]
MSAEKIVKTVCSTCYCGCGVLAHVREGKVVKIEGDPDHPRNKGELCPRGKIAAELLYHPDRLNYPLKRAGEKGEGKWQRISWDEALDTIANRLGDIKEQDGPEAICFSTGAGLYYNMGILGYMAYLLGTPNVMLDGHLCFMPAGFAVRATIGYESSILCSELIFDEVLKSDCILLWAANPRVTQPYSVGEGIFEVKEQRGTKLIVVDPRPTDYAKMADIWLKVKPATDDALALGMINVIINEELYDKKFVAEWTYGFDELKKHVQQYPPEKVSEITWVPAKDIIAAAWMFAETRPSVVMQRVPLDQTSNAVQTSRAILILTAICGNLDIKGGNLLPTKSIHQMSEFELFGAPQSKLAREVVEKRLGAREIPLLSGPDAGLAIVHPTFLHNSILTGKPYQTKAVIASAKNAVVADQDSRKVMKAFKKLDFFVNMDLFMTPSSELADIVLPTASWLEKSGLRGHPSHPFLIPIQHKVVEPLYERWDDIKFFTELAKKMKLDIPWKNEEEYADFRLKEGGITFKELDGVNFITMPKEYERHIKGKFEFKTQSKKVELYSTFLEKFGYDPLPHYKPPPETTSEFPLIMTGYKMEYVHSTGRQIETLRKLAPDPAIQMNTKTAKEKGIADGDWVRVETPFLGEKEPPRFRAKLIEEFLPQVIAVEHGWWFPEKHDPEHGVFESNINTVIPDDQFDPIYGCSAIKGLPCRVYKA